MKWRLHSTCIRISTKLTTRTDSHQNIETSLRELCDRRESQKALVKMTSKEFLALIQMTTKEFPSIHDLAGRRIWCGWSSQNWLPWNRQSQMGIEVVWSISVRSWEWRDDVLSWLGWMNLVEKVLMNVSLYSEWMKQERHPYYMITLWEKLQPDVTFIEI